MKERFKEEHFIKLFSHPFFLSTVCAFLTAFLALLTLKNGIRFTHDSWAYWEGSVSLLKTGKYTYFGGRPIIHFPPIFSLYLMIFQKIFGIHGWALILGIDYLAFATSFTFSYLFISLSNLKKRHVIVKLLLIIYISAFISNCYMVLWSETFLLFLYAILLAVLVSFNRKRYIKKEFLLRNLFLIFLIFLFMLLCRNASLAFVPGIFIVLFIKLYKNDWKKPFIISFLPVLSAILCWGLVRIYFGQMHSHPISLFKGMYSCREYLKQLIDGMVTFFGPIEFKLNVFVSLSIFFLWILTIIFLFKWKKYSRRAAFFQIMIILMSGIVGLFIIFNLTIIYNKFSGRFLWFVPITLVGSLVAYSSWLPQGKMYKFAILVLCLVTTLQLCRTVKYITYRLKNPSIFDVKPYFTIDPNYLEGPPIVHKDLVLISPPKFNFFDRNNY